jgi:hypothetical protein
MCRSIVALGLLVASASAPAAALAQLPYVQSFDGPDGSPWPAPWTAITPHVTVQDLQGNRARLNGTLQNVARMALPGFAETDVEVTVTVEFANVAGQGFGFYVRQNGGYLQDTLPHGQGYAMFLKGGWGWPEDLGIWHELDGVEIQFGNGYNPVAGGLQDDTPYRLRFRVTQQDASTTNLQAKVWPAAQGEPLPWTVEVTGTAPVLQGTAGSFAIDIYNQSGADPIFVDDLEIRRYPEPVGVPERGDALSMQPLRPNPVRFTARVPFTLASRGPVTLETFDVTGRRVARARAELGPGPVEWTWRAADARGERLPPGVYFLRIEAGGTTARQRVVVRR